MAFHGIFSSSIILIVGFCLLAWGADNLVSGAATLARKYGLSPRLIGLTIIAVGTSIPEMVIATLAAMHGNPSIAVGNAIGSNICNIGLVLGVTALIVPLTVRSATLKKELPVLFLTMIIVGFFLLDGKLTRIEGVLLVVSAVLVIMWLIQQGRKKPAKTPKDILDTEFRKEIDIKISTKKATMQLIFGLMLLPISSNLIVESAVHVAHYFNISDLVIGLTIFALGTSLPELATSLACARKKEYDIIIGNVIGSNIFNLLAVLGLPAIIHPIIFGRLVLYRDFTAMFVITTLFYFFAFGVNHKHVITRQKGAILLFAYVAYLLILYFI